VPLFIGNLEATTKPSSKKTSNTIVTITDSEREGVTADGKLYIYIQEAIRRCDVFVSLHYSGQFLMTELPKVM